MRTDKIPNPEIMLGVLGSTLAIKGQQTFDVQWKGPGAKSLEKKLMTSAIL